MSASQFTYRRRLGRCPSPPTWLWYEQIPLADDESDTSSGVDDDSCSEDDEEYSGREPERSLDEDDHSSDSGGEDPAPHGRGDCVHADDDGAHEQNSDADGERERDASEKMEVEGGEAGSGEFKKDIKGKQRAVDHDVEESPRRRERRKKQRMPMLALRPILTIQKSQGFVWNQDLFVPPYIKDRYVASTSPPNASGLYSTSASSLGSINDYEVDVVEIRVKEGEFANIIP